MKNPRDMHIRKWSDARSEETADRTTSNGMTDMEQRSCKEDGVGVVVIFESPMGSWVNGRGKYTVDGEGITSIYTAPSTLDLCHHA